MQYKFMICDGDSKAYGSIWDTYGSCKDCTKWENTKKSLKEYKEWVASNKYKEWRENHDSGEADCCRVIRKKQTKLSDGKSVKGSKHRLTDKAIDKLTTYHGNAIRANVKPGKLTTAQQTEQISVMQTAIKAVLYHCCELPNEKERHKYCPAGDSWCSYRKEGNLQRKDHHLDAAFLKFLLPEFERLSDYSLLLRCLPGYSQNANESINSLVWNRAPKHRYKGPHSVEIAVMSALMYFNRGASSRHEVMNAANILGGQFTGKGSMQKDKMRMARSVRKTQEKERRRKIRQAKLAAKLLEKEGEPSYRSGKFNEIDPLLGCESSDDSGDHAPLAQLLGDAQCESSDDNDDTPLARLLGEADCESSDDDTPLFQLLGKRQKHVD